MFKSVREQCRVKRRKHFACKNQKRNWKLTHKKRKVRNAKEKSKGVKNKKMNTERRNKRVLKMLSFAKTRRERQSVNLHNSFSGEEKDEEWTEETKRTGSMIALSGKKTTCKNTMNNQTNKREILQRNEREKEKRIL
jgi:hypothetical protein